MKEGFLQMTRNWLLGFSRPLGTAHAALALAVVLLLAGAATQAAQAQTLDVLHSFTGTPDGLAPQGDLIQDAAGNVYGTTSQGGTSAYGTVFKVDKTGQETVLYSFAGGKDGAYPIVGMVRDTKGTLYGMTQYGGGSTTCGSIGCGTVFKLTSAGKETVLHRFTGGKDGGLPLGSVIRDKSGNLYGTAYQGGKLTYGTVFKLDSTGKFSALYNFKGGANGANPDTTLVQDAAGTLYGTTWNGGVNAHGTVYSLTGSTYKVLYSFKGTQDAQCPCEGGLILDAAGNLYGVSGTGGHYGRGAIFRVNTASKEKILYSFVGAGGDGEYPLAGVVRDSAGNFYGTTYGGGASYGGTVFKISPAGKETILYNFDQNAGDPWGSMSGLVRDKNGDLFGMTYGGGGSGLGTVVKLTP